MPVQANAYDCGVYTILAMIHLRVGMEINNDSVPRHFLVAMEKQPLVGQRLELVHRLIVSYFHQGE